MEPFSFISGSGDIAGRETRRQNFADTIYFYSYVESRGQLRGLPPGGKCADPQPSPPRRDAASRNKRGISIPRNPQPKSGGQASNLRLFELERPREQAGNSAFSRTVTHPMPETDHAVALRFLSENHRLRKGEGRRNAACTVLRACGNPRETLRGALTSWPIWLTRSERSFRNVEEPAAHSSAEG